MSQFIKLTMEEYTQLKQQNQELREELDGVIKSRNIWIKENQDLKAFAKEACGLIELLYKEMDISSYDFGAVNMMTSVKRIIPKQDTTRAFMNTDKYKEYSK